MAQWVKVLHCTAVALVTVAVQVPSLAWEHPHAIYVAKKKKFICIIYMYIYVKYTYGNWYELRDDKGLSLRPSSAPHS